MMKNIAQIPRGGKTIDTIREHITFPLTLSLLAIAAAAFLGVAIGVSNPLYGAVVAGALIMVVVVLLRWDALAVTLIMAVHLWIDWYLGLHIVALLMALVLLVAYYFASSVEHPWAELRQPWLWILFLVLTFYPAINGGQFTAYDTATFYPNLVLGAFLMFRLGNVIAKDISALRRAFRLLAAFATIVAIHSVIEATTGVFLFASAREDAHLVTASNLDIVGTHASRAASFFIDPNWNSCFLATMFFLPLGLFIESKSLLAKTVYLAEMALILMALLFTYSNGSWVALLGGVVAFVYWVGSHRYRLSWTVMIALLALLVLVVFRSQLAVQLQHATGPNEFSSRVGAWETGILVIGAYPLFGVGMGYQAYLLRARPFTMPPQAVPLEQPHDSYIQWGATAGIAVLVVFLLLLGFAFWRSWRTWRAMDIRYRPLLGGGITALIALSINSVSIDGWTNAMIATLGWLVFGLLTSPLLYRFVHDGRHVGNQPLRADERIKTKV